MNSSSSTIIFHTIAFDSLGMMDQVLGSWDKREPLAVQWVVIDCKMWELLVVSFVQFCDIGFRLCGSSRAGMLGCVIPILEACNVQNILE